MTNHVCKLLEVVAKYMTQLLHSNDEQDTRTSADEMLKKLSEEWQEFFSISAYGNLLRITLRFAGMNFVDFFHFKITLHVVICLFECGRRDFMRAMAKLTVGL